MKSAEQIAEELFRMVWRGEFIPSNHWQKKMMREIEIALCNYADERIMADDKVAIYEEYFKCDICGHLISQIEHGIEVIRAEHECSPRR